MTRKWIWNRGAVKQLRLTDTSLRLLYDTKFVAFTSRAMSPVLLAELRQPRDQVGRHDELRQLLLLL